MTAICLLEQVEIKFIAFKDMIGQRQVLLSKYCPGNVDPIQIIYRNTRLK